MITYTEIIMTELDDCSICCFPLDKKIDVLFTTSCCKQQFHVECIKTAVEIVAEICPLCRAPLLVFGPFEKKTDKSPLIDPADYDRGHGGIDVEFLEDVDYLDDSDDVYDSDCDYESDDHEIPEEIHTDKLSETKYFEYNVKNIEENIQKLDHVMFIAEGPSCHRHFESTLLSQRMC